MSKGGAGAAGENLPSVADPLPGFRETPGMLLLRRLIRETETFTRGVRLDEEQRGALREVAAELDRALVATKPAQIGRLLEALMWHYPQAARPEAAARSVASDWIRDVGHLPEDILDAACTAWRRGTHAFAPSPGALLALANPIFSQRRHLRDVARRLVAPAGSDKAAVGGRT